MSPPSPQQYPENTPAMLLKNSTGRDVGGWPWCYFLCVFGISISYFPLETVPLDRYRFPASTVQYWPVAMRVTTFWVMKSVGQTSQNAKEVNIRFGECFKLAIRLTLWFQGRSPLLSPAPRPGMYRSKPGVKMQIYIQKVIPKFWWCPHERAVIFFAVHEVCKPTGERCVSPMKQRISNSWILVLKQVVRGSYNDFIDSLRVIWNNQRLGRNHDSLINYTVD